jgi:hypothetical protein
MREMTFAKAYKFLVGDLKGRAPLGDVDVDGVGYNVIMDVECIG